MDNFNLRKYLAENKLVKESEDFEETLYYINDYWRTDGEDYDSKEEFIHCFIYYVCYKYREDYK